ncbi:hypothetical protein [Paramicrobacterium chengjingii]|uniref:Transporter n=1 Tax=Paramicrobacterium chengjingii TaxID=2769067 RepID=A0ABX6YF30_9MICO|nr:hypothetical protein [Microbacterium chengjingii]QPZ37408.1 hypothetical protein HCR76_11215 [Microbacterium chengjingii]
MNDNAHEEPRDEALDPAEMLRLLNDQQKSVESQFSSIAWKVSAIWGIAWTIGFGAVWLVDGLKPAFSIPKTSGYIVLGVVVSIAVVVSVVSGVRSGRGVRTTKADAFVAAAYGSTWPLTMIGFWLFGMALLSQGMSDTTTEFYFSSGFVLMTGFMMAVSAAVWKMKSALAVGVWLVIIAAVAPFFGTPGNYLFLAMSGGLVFIGFAVAIAAYNAGLKRRVTGGNHG